MRPNPKIKAAGAFTVIELTVAIGIILILSGVLLPALCNAKQQARSMACKSNLHQIGLALTLYVSDFQKYPTAAAWMAAAVPTAPKQKVLPYAANNRNIFYCPSQKLAATSMVDRTVTRPLSYGCNHLGSARFDLWGIRLGIAAYPPVSASEVRAPSDMIMVGDSGSDTFWDMTLNPNVLPIGPDTVAMTANSWLPSKRHKGGANILFCDAHVEHAIQGKWMEKTDRARRRWNNDHEPHPETW